MKTRVALVTQDLTFGGGVPTMTSFLHRVLRESGRYDPEVVCLATAARDPTSVLATSPSTWRGGPRLETREWRGIRYTHVGAWISEFEFQRYRPRAVLTQLLQQFDIIQFIVGAAPPVLAAGDLNKPVFTWAATTVWADRVSRLSESRGARKLWWSAMTRQCLADERRALEATDQVFALSEYTVGALRTLLPTRSILLAPCGVDTELYRPAPEPCGEYIICTARFSDPRKNVRLLLQAYAELRVALPTTPPLYLVGEPPASESDRLIRELRLDGCVRVLGLKQPAELAELYRNATLFVLSSDEEGLGIVILEAMASGLPVISTACGGPETAVIPGETGLLTPVGDVSALATAMRCLLQDREMRLRMGQAGRRRATDVFSITAAGGIFLDAYDRALGQRQSADGRAGLTDSCLADVPSATSGLGA